MALPFRLETFEAAEAHSASRDRCRSADLEEAKLAAFEKGYTAGWEDAVAAQDDEVAELRADLGRNLQALSFSYHEAQRPCTARARAALARHGGQGAAVDGARVAWAGRARTTSCRSPKARRRTDDRRASAR